MCCLHDKGYALLLTATPPPQPQPRRLGTKVARLGATRQGHVGAGNRAFHLGCWSVCRHNNTLDDLPEQPLFIVCLQKVAAEAAAPKTHGTLSPTRPNTLNFLW